MKTTSCDNSEPDAVRMFLEVNDQQDAEVFDSPVFIAVAGGTASGKTSFCENVIEYLDRHRIAQPGQVVIITQDCFYRNLTPEEQNLAAHSDFDFDSPGAFDFALMRATLQKLQSGRKVRIPQYDFKTNSRCEGQWTEIGRVDVVILEGIFALYDKEINKLMSMKLFVDCDSDIRLARRIKRDIIERGRKLEGVLTQYMRFVKVAFDTYISPTRRNADLIVLHGKENKGNGQSAQITQVRFRKEYALTSPIIINNQINASKTSLVEFSQQNSENGFEMKPVKRRRENEDELSQEMMLNKEQINEQSELVQNYEQVNEQNEQCKQQQYKQQYEDNGKDQEEDNCGRKRVRHDEDDDDKNFANDKIDKDDS